MKKFPLILFIFSIFSINLHSHTVWRLDIFSYTGGRSYLEYFNIFNHMRYTPINTIKFTLNYKNKKNFYINTTIKNKKDILNDIPFIYKLSATYKTKEWEIGFLKDYIGFGRNSYLFNSYILSPYFDKYFFGNYNFFGFTLTKHLNSFLFSFRLGGNEFNREILDFQVSYKVNSKNYITLFTQKIVKDNTYNENLFPLGCEINIKKPTYSISGIAVYKYYKELYQEKSYFLPQFFIETTFSPNDFFRIGLNINYENFPKGLPEKLNYNLFFNSGYSSISNKIILKYDTLNKKKHNDEITLILNKNFNAFKFGIIASYGISFEKKKYLELGINISINYENN